LDWIGEDDYFYARAEVDGQMRDLLVALHNVSLGSLDQRRGANVGVPTTSTKGLSCGRERDLALFDRTKNVANLSSCDTEARRIVVAGDRHPSGCFEWSDMAGAHRRWTHRCRGRGVRMVGGCGWDTARHRARPFKLRRASRPRQTGRAAAALPHK
jgi:hypothetical protein